MTPARRPHSIRASLGLLVAVATVPLAGLYAREAYTAYKHAGEEARRESMLLAEGVATGTRVTLSLAREAATSLAARFGVDALAEPSGCQEILSTAIAGLPMLTYVAMVDTLGFVRCGTLGMPSGGTIQVGDREWFRTLRRTEAFTLGPPVIGRVSGLHVVTLAAPVFSEDGTLVGALAGGMELTRLQELLADFRLGPDELVTIGSSDGRVLARSLDPDRWVGKRLPPSSTATLTETIDDGRFIYTATDLEGVTRSLARVDIPEVGLRVWAGLSVEQVSAVPRARARQRALAGLSIMLAAILLAAWFYQGIARPLSALAGGVELAASGRSVPVPTRAPVEVLVVVEQLNKTLEARARAEAIALHAGERYRSIVDNAVFGVFLASLDGRFLHVNPELVSILGYENAGELKRASLASLFAKDSGSENFLLEHSVKGAIEDVEIQWLSRSGEALTLRLNGRLVPSHDGEPAFQVWVENVTERRRLAGLLLRQARIETVGRMAGGLAHEFNNLLTVILANVQLMEEELGADHPLCDETGEATRAAHRAMLLTRRLLTFGQRAVVRPQIVAVDKLVGQTGDAIEDFLGSSTRREMKLGAGDANVLVDPGQLEQILLNLVINAQDALSDGGLITIETALRDDDGAQTGRSDTRPFVLITVSDDGPGMAPEVLERACEPFFTMKPVGEGTGLGLSTVHGIVTEAGGRLNIESELGVGTLVEVWLPRV